LQLVEPVLKQFVGQVLLVSAEQQALVLVQGGVQEEGCPHEGLEVDAPPGERLRLVKRVLLFVVPCLVDRILDFGLLVGLQVFLYVDVVPSFCLVQPESGFGDGLREFDVPVALDFLD